MLTPTIYKIDFRVNLTETPPPPSSAAAATASATAEADRRLVVYNIKAEFHYALWPLHSARLLPNFRRFNRRASLTAQRVGDCLASARDTVHNLLFALDLVLPEEVVYGTVQKLLHLSSCVAWNPTVDTAPALSLELRISAAHNLGRPSAAARHDKAQRLLFMLEVAEKETGIRAVPPAPKSSIEALECVPTSVVARLRVKIAASWRS